MFKTLRRAAFALSLYLLASAGYGGVTSFLIQTGFNSLSQKTATQTAQTSQVTGRAIHIDDGDTVILLMPDNSKLRVRLASIDAPEVSHTSHQTGRIGQPYSNNSKDFLASMVHGRVVAAECPEKDKYGRSVCTLSVGGTNVNAEMVRNGWAWANTANNGRYLRDRSFISLQEEARLARRGLWQGRNPVEPWEWRHVCWESGGTACPQ